jgi:outer membrane protein OmpA-like peptidoglycan-associated protein
MTDPLPSRIFRVRCKIPSCGKDLVLANLFCNKCGFVGGYVESADPDRDYSVVCQRCGGDLPEQPLPARCASCGGDQLEWWNLSGTCWHQPNLSVRDDLRDAVWLSGDFDGEYHGSLSSGPSLAESSHLRSLSRRYELKVRGGTLANAVRVGGPPLSIAPDESKPIRQLIVPEVLIPSQDEGEEAHRLVLYDFRLHHWDVLAQMEIPAGVISHDSLAGHIVGKAYGCLVPAEAEPTVARPEVRPEGRPEVRPVVLPIVPPVLKPAIKVPEPSIPCASCSWMFRTLFAVALWIGCGWEVASLGLAAMCFACWIPSLPFYERVARQFFLRQGMAGQELILLSLLGLAIYFHLASQNGCAVTGFWPLTLCLISLLFSAWIHRCWVKIVISILWILALFSWCGARSTACNAGSTISSLPVFVGVNQLRQNVDTFFASAVPDTISSVVSNASLGLREQQRFSIDDVRRNPSVIAECGSSIYFPNATMFDLDKTEIKDSGEIQLRKLDVLQSSMPSARIIVVGHADRVGDGTLEGNFHNIELSEKRASAVAEWLVTHGRWRPDQIEARGAGSREPIIDVPGDEPLNRRVEIRLHCSSSPAKAKTP